jgi:protein subunit release factor A
MENSTKKEIIQQEIKMYDNTSYLLSLRMRIAKKTDDKSMESTIENEMIKCEKALDTLNEELKSLDRV